MEFTSRASEWLVLAYLLVAVTPAILFHHHALTIVPHLNLLDDSWRLDTSYKALGGLWFGRDVAFTYGPLFQWLSSAPSRWIGVSAGSVLATVDTLLLSLVILATFVTARLLLPEAAPWRRALLVLLAVVYWSAPDLRGSLALLAFAMFVQLCDGAADRDAAVGIRGFIAALICATAFLFSADTGLYCVAALLLCIGATAVARGAWRQMGALLLVSFIFASGLMLAINAAMFTPLNFRYWKSSLAIATGYRWFEPLAMAKRDKHLVLAALVLGLVIFAVGWVWRRSRRDWSARPAFLFAGFCTALVLMQSALVRSDHGHVVMGVYPMIFLCGVIVLHRFALSPWMELASALAIVVLTLGFAQPVGAFRPADFAAHLQQLRRPQLACPAGYQLMEDACFTATEAQWLGGISSFVQRQAAPDFRIAVFPYQTAFGLLSARQVAGRVMQGYLVNGEYLTDLELQSLRGANPSVALYFPDSPVGPSLDFVPSFTRSPEVWLYYLRHYQKTDSPGAEVLGLVRDDSREGRVRLASERIGSPSAAVAVHRRSTTFDLGPMRWPAEGADFLKLRVRVDYPFWWRLRKPSCYTLQLSFADGSQKSLQFVLQPDRATDIWVYPWQDESLGNYFSPDVSQWRTPNRPAVTGLQLLVTPHDWISVVPKSVSVESIQAVRVDFQ